MGGERESCVIGGVTLILVEDLEWEGVVNVQISVIKCFVKSHCLKKEGLMSKY